MNKRLASLCFCACLAVGGCATAGMDGPPSAVANQNRQVYELYRQYMETLNENRRRAGVPPVYIRTYEEWRQAPSAE
jgi:hypothetical protein